MIYAFLAGMLFVEAPAAHLPAAIVDVALSAMLLAYARRPS